VSRRALPQDGRHLADAPPRWAVVGAETTLSVAGAQRHGDHSPRPGHITLPLARARFSESMTAWTTRDRILGIASALVALAGLVSLLVGITTPVSEP
jgi:hypothetical protein